MAATTLIITPATVAAYQFTTGNTSGALNVSAFTVYAPAGNGASIYIGDSNVTTSGFALAPGASWSYISTFKENSAPESENLAGWYVKLGATASSVVVMYFK